MGSSEEQIMHSHHHDTHASTKNIKIAFFLNLLFAIVELAGGLWTNSIAILSDALHDFGDSLSLGISWYFQHLSKKERDHTYSYGYGRFSVIGAIITSIVLICGSLFILANSLPRLLHPQPLDSGGMILLAVGGIVFNAIAAWRLHTGSSMNEKAVYLHLLEDILGWTATLIGAVIMQYWQVPWIDPILAMGIALFILYNVIKNLKKAAKIILQAIPDGINIEHISGRLKNIPEVHDVRDCHIWSLDGTFNILSVHLVVSGDKNLHTLTGIKSEAKRQLRDQNVQHVTIEFETKDEACEPCKNR